MTEGQQTLRILEVSATVHPEVNEQALAETVQQVLRESELLGHGIEIGTVDVYEHQAHSGGLND